MSAHVPTLDNYAAAFCLLECHTGCPAKEGFDRWLDKHTREAQARALEEAAEYWESGAVEPDEIKFSSDAPLGWSEASVLDAVLSSGPVMDWLRKRAQQL